MSVDVANAVQRFFDAIDSRDWGRAEALMADPFFLDYSSFGAPTGSDLAPKDVLSGWRAVLPGFDVTHHQLGPLDITIDADAATVRAYVTATHQIADAKGGDLWVVYGRYVLKLVNDGGWKLRANTFQFKFLTGNSDLPLLAQTRAAS